MVMTALCLVALVVHAHLRAGDDGTVLAASMVQHEACDASLDDLVARTAKGEAKYSEVANTCFSFISKYEMHVPEEKENPDHWPEGAWGSAPSCAKDAWSKMDCEKHLALYDARTLSEDDGVPDFVLKPILGEKERELLSQMTIALVQHLNGIGAGFFAGFGTLLGAVRARTLQPWDDDMDFVVCDAKCAREKALKKPFDGLELVANGTSPWCDPAAERAHAEFGSLSSQHPPRDPENLEHCKVWKLSNGFVLTWKNWGCPYKVSHHEHKFPFVDIYTLAAPRADQVFMSKEVPDVLEIEPAQLKNGHIMKFEHNNAEIFPTQTLKFALPNGARVDLPIPAQPKEVLREDYGDDSIENCVVSHSHMYSSYCKEPYSTDSDSECKSPLAKQMPKLSFPCSLWTKTLDESDERR